jgi:hypothetical protein
MVLLIILIIIEILTLITIRQHFYEKSWMRYYFFIIINMVISVWVWILWIKTASYRGIFDETEHVWLLMTLTGALCTIMLPKIILNLFHFSGVVARRNTGGHNRKITNTGLIISLAVFLMLSAGTLHGRFNFKTEEITVKVKGLNPDLEGFRIIQISDLHLSSFYHHKNLLLKVMEDINRLDPDIIINTGDFVTIGWREFGRFDTVLNVANGKYGNYAVLGNHDFGTYDPYFTEADKETNVLLLNKLIATSGYTVLNDESTRINVGSAKISLTGVVTKGSFPEIISGDLTKAVRGSDSVDFKILLTHDPNHWESAVRGKTDIDLTFSGHTHGMQIGIITKKVAWSPASYFYPRWNGLYGEGDQFLIVNRGLGVLGIPFRIWMPPEISVVTLIAG